MSQIIMIGTDHCDRKGRKRLEDALEIEHPDVITVEASFSISNFFLSRRYEEIIEKEVRAAKSKRYSPNILIQAEKYVRETLFYEVRGAGKYARKRGISVLGINEEKEGFIDQFVTVYSRADAVEAWNADKEVGRWQPAHVIEAYYQ